MLPNHQRILLQIGHVIEWRERVELEHQPADVGVKETFGDAIRVFIVIDMLVVGTVFAGPEERRVFKSPGAENQREEPYAPVRLESEVREEPMVSDRDGKSAGAEHDKEKRYLEPIDSEEIKIGGHRGEREKQGADEKRACRPIDFFERDSREHGVVRSFESPGADNRDTVDVTRILFTSEVVNFLCNNDAGISPVSVVAIPYFYQPVTIAFCVSRCHAQKRPKLVGIWRVG